MKIIKYLLGLTILMVFIFLLGHIFISPKFKVERTVFVEVSDSTAYQYALNLDYNNKWNPYYKDGLSNSYALKGRPGLSGYTYTIKNKNADQTKIEFLSTIPNKAIFQKITLTNPINGTFDNHYYFSASYKGTFVTMQLSGENASLIDKWRSLFYDDIIGEDYQEGLDKLKIELEKAAMLSANRVYKTRRKRLSSL